MERIHIFSFRLIYISFQSNVLPHSCFHSSIFRRIIRPSQHTLTCCRDSRYGRGRERLSRCRWRRLIPSRSSSLHPLIQSSKRKGASSLGLLALSHAFRTSGSVLAQETGEPCLASCEDLLISGGDIFGRERSAYLQHNQEIKDAIRDECDWGLQHVREETGEGEGLAGIALYA